MRLFPLMLLCSIPLSSLQGSGGSSSIENSHSESTCSRGKAHNDLMPLLRFEMTPRFFNDEGAMLFLGEFGQSQNRFNASIGFTCAEKQYLKFGGEILNQQLTYKFPYQHGDRWMSQYAAGASYLMAFDYWGFRGLEISAQYSNVQRENVHPYLPKNGSEEKNHHYNDRDLAYKRAIAASKGYAVSAGLDFSPYCWLSLKTAVVYDRVEYDLKYSHRKIVEGVGGIITFEQQLNSTISLEVKGELRKPYNYYEGRLLWRILLCGADVTVGAFGGHTEGKYRLLNSTVAGIEIGFDFGVDNFSGLSSVRLSDDPSYSRGFFGQDTRTLKWLASPSVYIPEILAISEQRKAKYSEVRHEHHHHHHHHDRSDVRCGCHGDEGVNIPDSRREIRAEQLRLEQEGIDPFIDQYPGPN